MQKLLFLSMTVLFLTGHLSAHSQQELRVKQFNISKSSLAIQGYDPVTYFNSNKAVAGKKELTYTYQQITYRFSTPQTRDLFIAEPSKYEPQYGGWCAYAMGSSGEKVEIDPETFKIINGKLYLFYNSFFNNTLKSWNKDEAKLKTNADANWSRIYR